MTAVGPAGPAHGAGVAPNRGGPRAPVSQAALRPSVPNGVEAGPRRRLAGMCPAGGPLEEMRFDAGGPTP